MTRVSLERGEAGGVFFCKFKCNDATGFYHSVMYDIHARVRVAAFCFPCTVPLSLTGFFYVSKCLCISCICTLYAVCVIPSHLYLEVCNVFLEGYFWSYFTPVSVMQVSMGGSVGVNDDERVIVKCQFTLNFFSVRANNERSSQPSKIVTPPSFVSLGSFPSRLFH